MHSDFWYFSMSIFCRRVRTSRWAPLRELFRRGFGEHVEAKCGMALCKALPSDPRFSNLEPRQSRGCTRRHSAYDLLDQESVVRESHMALTPSSRFLPVAATRQAEPSARMPKTDGSHELCWSHDAGKVHRSHEGCPMPPASSADSDVPFDPRINPGLYATYRMHLGKTEWRWRAREEANCKT